MNNTVKQLLPALGTTVLVRCGALAVACIVIDVKNAYGRERFHVKPVVGEGTEWVEMSRIVRVLPEVTR